MRNALTHSASGAFLKVVMWTSFVWSINYKPRDFGTYQYEKREILRYFWSTTTKDSAVFRKHAEDIAKALGKPLSCEDDYGALYNFLPELASFKVKGHL